MTSNNPQSAIQDPKSAYHCFLGNGLDAVLIGRTGSMVEARAQGNLDRCYWYKADRYYPEERVAIIPGRLPREGQPLHAEGQPWRELAPLARTWYEVRYGGLRLDVRSSEQHFVPAEGTLYSKVDFGAVNAEVVTFLHATRSLLVTRYKFDKPVDFRAYAAAGVWVEEGYDADPLDEVSYSEESSEVRYRLGDTRGRSKLAVYPEGQAGADDRCCWLEVSGQEFEHYFSVEDDYDSPLNETTLDEAGTHGYEALRDEHVAFWREYSRGGRIDIPDEAFQGFYDYSLYQFKASQNRLSGGIPVNNLRLTWSSHVFWDAYFMHHALLEANRRPEALNGARFFLRTIEHARRHALEEFGAPGLKWDWEITHRGEKAYGTWAHQKEQVHNNASYANIIWGYYASTRDRAYLAEFYPLLRGIAEFFMANVIIETERGYEVRALVDVHERVTRVKNEGLNLTGAIRVLQLAARAAGVLGIDEAFAAQCSEVASSLVPALDLLYNGRYFMGAEDVDTLNFSSLAAVYPMMVIPADDPRAVSTSRAYLEQTDQHSADTGISSPWSAGILATVFAMQDDGDTAWRIISDAAPALCEYGGMSEYVLPGGCWNMQYFSTAQAAVCTAIHHLMLQERGGEIHLFPAVPTVWPECSFEKLLVSGVEVSGQFDRAARRARVEIRNITNAALDLAVQCGGRSEKMSLDTAQVRLFEWEIS